MTKNYAFYFTFSLSLLLTRQQAAAQLKTGDITGKVTNRQGNAIPDLQLALIGSKDTILIKMAISDSNGQYVFHHIPAGSYRITTTSPGYNFFTSQSFGYSPSPYLFSAEPIQLIPLSQNLAEVKISASKPMIIRQADKIVVNVESSAIFAGSSVLEVIAKSPGITLDRDDQITMSGKQQVLIMINGKQTYLNAEQVISLLRNMQSTEVEAVELIANPSSRYDATGKAGIINIRTKKDKRFGLNMSLTGGAGYGQTSKYNGGVNLNFKRKKFSIFGNYNQSSAGNELYVNLNRKVVQEDTTSLYEQYTKFNQRRKSHAYQAGTDYNINTNHTLGLLVNGYHNASDAPDNNSFTTISSIHHDTMQTDGNTNVQSAIKERYVNTAYSLNYTGKSASGGKILTADLDYAKYKGSNRDYRNIDTIYHSSRGIYDVRNSTLSDIKIKAAKTDYTHPFNEHTKLDAGLKASWVKTDNKLDYLKSAGDEQDFKPVPSYSNRFIYTERIVAAYVTLQHQHGKIHYQAGLRTEHTQATAEPADQVIKRYTYLDLFPSAVIDYKLNAQHDLTLTYSRRIDRPDYDRLNPAMHELDNKTFILGNEFLKPEYSQSIALSHTFHNKLTTTLGYTYTRDAMIQLTEQNDATAKTFLITRNIDNQKNYALTIFAAQDIVRGWQCTNNFNLYYNSFTYTAEGNQVHNGQTSAHYTMNHSVSVYQGIVIDAALNYQSALTYGVDKIHSFMYADAGLRKTFLEKKLNVKLSVNDIFNGWAIHGVTQYRNVDLTFNQKRESRIGKILVSYNFGSSTDKVTRQTGNAEAQGRLKN